MDFSKESVEDSENQRIFDTSTVRTSRETVEELDDERERENLKKIEAALFIAGRFLSLKELVSLTDVNPILLRKLLNDLCDKYSDFGINVVRKGDMWKMDVAEEHFGIVNKLATGNSEFSSAEQETLAIIAYKQPIKQSVVVKIRGNKAYEHIKKFVNLGLVNKKKAGHTSELSLKEEFYDYFNLGEKSKQVDKGAGVVEGDG
jgi:segregation and condensation protein B